MDAIGETSCYGRYANDPLEDQLVNAKVVWDGSKLILVAQWDINPGEEILISYGIDYWRSRLHLLDDETRSRAEALIKKEDDRIRKGVKFKDMVKIANYREDSIPTDVKKGLTREPLSKPAQNLNTSVAQTTVEVDVTGWKDDMKEERIKEEFLHENVFECEELAEQIAYRLNGRTFEDEGRTYQIKDVTFDKDYEVVVGWRRPLGRPHPSDAAAYRVFGKEGLYELSERYLLDHPEEEDDIEWPSGNIAWAAEQHRDSMCIKMINTIRQTGGSGVVRNNAKYMLIKSDEDE